MAIVKDRVKETSTSTGTGNFALAGASPMFRTINAAYGIGVAFDYAIIDDVNGDWEIGIGQLSSATVLVRTTVNSSSNSNNLVNFLAGAKTVFGTIAAESFNNKVDKVAGKDLSTNDYTTTEKNKLAGISAGATANDTDANLKNRANHIGTQLAATISDFDSAADARITAQKGAANGLAPLGADSKIASAYLPSFVDDVLEYANLAAFPATGETAKIYVALDTNKTYRWSGSAYVEISASPGSTDAVTEGAANLYFTSQRVRDVVLTGLSVVTNAAVVAADSILVAVGKLQAQITAALADIATRAGLGLNNIFTGRNRFAATIGAWQTETFSATEVLDASIPFGVITATATFTFDSVTNAGAAGEAQVLYREIRQDATGGRTASYNTANFEKVGTSFPVLSTAANARDFLTFTRSQNGKWLVTAGLNVS